MPDGPTQTPSAIVPAVPELKIVSGAIGGEITYFLPILAITGICYAPVALFTLLVGPAAIERDDLVPIFLVWGLLAGLGGIAADGAIVRGMLARRELGHFAIRASLKQMLANYPTLILLRMISGLAIGFGCVLAIVPGVIAFCGFAIAVPCVMMEEAEGAVEALKRSWALTRGLRLRIFGGLLGLNFLLGLAGQLIEAGLRRESASLRIAFYGAWFLFNIAVNSLIAVEIYDFVRATAARDAAVRAAAASVDAVPPTA